MNDMTPFLDAVEAKLQSYPVRFPVGVTLYRLSDGRELIEAVLRAQGATLPPRLVDVEPGSDFEANMVAILAQLQDFIETTPDAHLAGGVFRIECHHTIQALILDPALWGLEHAPFLGRELFKIFLETGCAAENGHFLDSSILVSFPRQPSPNAENAR